MRCREAGIAAIYCGHDHASNYAAVVDGEGACPTRGSSSPPAAWRPLLHSQLLRGNCAARPTAAAGVQLAYGQKTGYGSYGPLPGHPMRRGARVVLLQQGGGSSTWLRQEGGSLVQQAAAAAEENGAAWVRQQASCLVENS